MTLTEEEQEICKQYGARDEEGYVHCHECPLVAYRQYAMCKANMTAEEWREYETNRCGRACQRNVP